MYNANLNQPLNQLKFINASYDTYCEKYLLKLKICEIVQLCMIHRSIYDLAYSERYSLRYHIFYIRWVLLDNSELSIKHHSYIVLFAYFSTFNGYCLIIQIINQIPFIYFAVYAKFSVNMVNPYGGQYIVLSPIEMHLFNHCVKALLLANIVYFYI